MLFSPRPSEPFVRHEMKNKVLSFKRRGRRRKSKRNQQEQEIELRMNKTEFQNYSSSPSPSFPHPLRTFSIRPKVQWWDQILDPGSEFVDRWNRVFLFTSLFALFIDPLYFFQPVIDEKICMRTDIKLGVVVTILRTFVDMLFIFHIVLKFRTAYVAPNSRVFGRGELVMDPKLIAIRYVRTDFFIDLAATLPLPQIMTWFVIPALKSPGLAHTNDTLTLIVLIQYIPRFFQFFPLRRRIIKNSGLIIKNAWLGAIYNLGFYILASHIAGSSWYLLSIQREYECWRIECGKERNSTQSPSCQFHFLDCYTLDSPEREAWTEITKVLTHCDALNDHGFDFGMFAPAFTNEVASSRFFEKYFYCLWWGLKSLSSYGQNIETSTSVFETLYSSIICISGLILFSHLIGNMQSSLQSTSARLEEWRTKHRDTEEWMRHRQLPEELQEKVRRFVQYKWTATRGVDERAILNDLPLDLRRQIQRHLCLALVRRVPFFSQMDDQLLDAICEHLVSSLNTKETYIVREGDPVNEMLFIIRGQLESSTTDGGRSGFFNSIILKQGDFCGEELLTWALMPSSDSFPSSTRTVKCLTEVEAFALCADDLKFVATQFKRLHSKKLQHGFRYYSHQWRTWGACFIQAAWRRYYRRKMALELVERENLFYGNVLDPDVMSGVGSTIDNENRRQGLGVTVLASRFAANTRRGTARKVALLNADAASLKMPKLFKPEEPDFSADPEDN